MLFACSDKAAGSDAAFVEESPPRATHSQVEEPLKASEEMSAQKLMEELGTVADCQAELVTQLKTRYAAEGSNHAQKDEEIALLRAQLADARADVESTTAHARRLADEKLALMVEVKCERAAAEQYRSNCAWGLKYLQENRGKHFAQLDEFRKSVETALEAQESKLRKLSIEYDEELYPHLVSAVAERRYVCLFDSLTNCLRFLSLKLCSFNACVVAFLGG